MQELKLFQDKREFFWYKLLCRCKVLCYAANFVIYMMYACIFGLWWFIIAVWSWSSFSPMFIFEWPLKIFPCCGQPDLHTNFLTVTFRAEHLSSILLSIFRLQCNNFTCPVIQRTLRLPCKTNHGVLGVGQVDFSLDLLIGLKIPKSDRSEDPFFFSVHFSLLCVLKCWQLLPYAFSPCVRSLHASLCCTTIHSFH